MTNPRIEDLGNGITKERIAVQTHMFYDASASTAKIVFQAQPCLYVGGAYQGPAGDFENLIVELADIASNCYGAGTDPVTGAELTNISAAGVMLLMKAAFASVWDTLIASEQEAAAGHAAVAAEFAAQAGAAS